MDYTEQLELDKMGLGERWGCTFTGFPNVFEHALRRKAEEWEIDQVVGAAFRGGFAGMANYKHHDYGVDNDLPPPEGWDAKANPEWGYYVKSRLYLFAACTKIFKKRVDHMRYHVAIMKTQYGTRHYCVLAPRDELINPDPSLEGPIIETRPFIY